MAFNWTITAGTPILTAGMSFQVRYRLLPSTTWQPFLPNPTTNTFTITGITDGIWEVEIRTVCVNGNISNPTYHQKSFGLTTCNGSNIVAGPLPVAQVGVPYTASIALTGTPPFTLIEFSGSWAVGTINGSSLDITGLPDGPADFPLHYVIQNSCSINTFDLPTIIVNDNGGGEGYSVFISRNGNELVADVFGGVAPFQFSFYCDTSGSGICNAYTIANQSQLLNTPPFPTQARTGFTFTAYQGAHYKFFCVVTDFNGNLATSNFYTAPLCLVPETLVLMQDGTEKELRHVKKGDLLFGENNVLDMAAFKTNKLFVINNGLLKTSDGHINILSDGRLVTSQDLKEGDLLVTKNGVPVEVRSIEILEGDFEVINIATLTTDFIANGILTHNKISC